MKTETRSEDKKKKTFASLTEREKKVHKEVI